MDPKSSPHSGSQKVRFCCYLPRARSDVSEMDPFWELFEDKFCTTYEKIGNGGYPKIGAEKRHPHDANKSL